MFKQAFAVVGKNGSGKSTLSDYLSGKGFSVYSLSDIVRDEVSKRGLPADRDTLTSTANEMKQSGGLHVFAQKVIDKAVAEQKEYVVFDSVRNVDEVLFLKEQGVVVVGVDAPLEVRYARIQSRKRATDHVDFETFKAQDERENGGKSYGQNIEAALQACSTILRNDQDPSALYQKIEALLLSVGVC